MKHAIIYLFFIFTTSCLAKFVPEQKHAASSEDALLALSCGFNTELLELGKVVNVETVWYNAKTDQIESTTFIHGLNKFIALTWQYHIEKVTKLTFIISIYNSKQALIGLFKVSLYEAAGIFLVKDLQGEWLVTSRSERPISKEGVNWQLSEYHTILLKEENYGYTSLP